MIAMLVGWLPAPSVVTKIPRIDRRTVFSRNTTRRPPCVSMACHVGTSSTVLPLTRKSDVGGSLTPWVVRTMPYAFPPFASDPSTPTRRTTLPSIVPSVPERTIRPAYTTSCTSFRLQAQVGDIPEVGPEAAKRRDLAVADRQPADGCLWWRHHVDADLVEDVRPRLRSSHDEAVERDVVGLHRDPRWPPPAR